MENERNCSNCGNYRPNGDYQNNNSGDRGSFAPLIILLLFCALAYFIYQNNQLQDELQTFQDRHNSCISVDKSGNMWFTKGDMSELVTPSNIWDELEKLGADDVEEYSSKIENSSSRQYNNINDYSKDSSETTHWVDDPDDGYNDVKDYSGEYTQNQAKEMMK